MLTCVECTHLFIVSISIGSHHDPAYVGNLYFGDLVLRLSLPGWNILLSLFILLLGFRLRSLSGILGLNFCFRAEACGGLYICLVFLVVRRRLVSNLCFRVRSLREKNGEISSAFLTAHPVQC